LLCWERLLSDVKSVKDKPAAAIEEARAKKYQTYNPLLYVIKKQVLDGRRQREPRFTPAAVTTFGELGPGCTGVHACRSGWRDGSRGTWKVLESDLTEQAPPIWLASSERTSGSRS